MEGSSSAPRRTGRIMLVLELERDVYHPPKFLRVCVSRPGTDGTMSRVFSTDGERVDGRDVQEVIRWIIVTVNNALATSEGIQGVMEMIDWPDTP